MSSAQVSDCKGSGRGENVSGWRTDWLEDRLAATQQLCLGVDFNISSVGSSGQLLFVSPELNKKKKSPTNPKKRSVGGSSRRCDPPEGLLWQQVASSDGVPSLRARSRSRASRTKRAAAEGEVREV